MRPAQNAAGYDPALQRGGDAAANPVRSRQGKLVRAAYTPPLRSAGDWQFILFVRGLRKVVGRGLDPAAGMFRQVRHSRETAGFSYVRRGGPWAARERSASPERSRQGKTLPPFLSGPQARDPPHLLSIIYYLLSFFLPSLQRRKRRNSHNFIPVPHSTPGSGLHRSKR